MYIYVSYIMNLNEIDSKNNKNEKAEFIKPIVLDHHNIIISDHKKATVIICMSCRGTAVLSCAKCDLVGSHSKVPYVLRHYVCIISFEDEVGMLCIVWLCGSHVGNMGYSYLRTIHKWYF